MNTVTESCFLPYDIIRFICLLRYSILPDDYTSSRDLVKFFLSKDRINRRNRGLVVTSRKRMSIYFTVIRLYEAPVDGEIIIYETTKEPSIPSFESEDLWDEFTVPKCESLRRTDHPWIHRSNNQEACRPLVPEEYRILRINHYDYPYASLKYDLIRAEVSKQYPGFQVCNICVLFHTGHGFKEDTHILKDNETDTCISCTGTYLNQRIDCPDTSKWIYIIECHKL